MFKLVNKMAGGPLPPGVSPNGSAGVPAFQAVFTTWIAWAVFFLAVCIILFWKETGTPVNTAYASGAERWLAHEDLYGGGCGFIYLPQSAILYGPFYLLPYAG